MTYLSIFRLVDGFVWLWSGRLVSALGDGAQLVILLWFASNSPTSSLGVGLVAAALMIPGAIMTPFMGPLVDRYDRRGLLIASDLSRVALTLAMPLSYIHFGLAALIVVVAIQSVVDALFSTTYSASLPDIVGKELLPVANSIGSVTLTVSGAAGAALGGILSTRGDALLVFSINSATFLISAISIAAIPKIRFSPVEHEIEKREDYVESLKAGMRYIQRAALPRKLIIAGVIATVGFAPAPVALVALSKAVLHANSQQYGFLNALIPVGLACGSLAAGSLRNTSNLARSGVAFLGMALATLLLGLTSTLWLAAVLLTARAAFNGFASVSVLSLLQSMVDTKMRGRVFGLMYFLQEIPRALILPGSGLIIALLGVRSTYATMGVFITVAGGWLLFHMISRPDSEHETKATRQVSV